MLFVNRSLGQEGRKPLSKVATRTTIIGVLGITGSSRTYYNIAKTIPLVESIRRYFFTFLFDFQSKGNIFEFRITNKGYYIKTKDRGERVIRIFITYISVGITLG